MRRIIYSSGIIALLAMPLQAWWSLDAAPGAYPTHKYISESAINYLDQKYPGQYPDIHKFAGTITGATYTPYNDKVAHGFDPAVSTTSIAENYDGGDYKGWWVKYVLPNYVKSNFDGNLNSYFCIGSMAHLVQDQLVPAHAANIYHASNIGGIPTNPDDLEAYTGLWGFIPSVNTDMYNGKDPTAYYYGADKYFSPIYNTQQEIKTWTYPDTGPVTEWRGRRYWFENPYVQYKYTG